MPVDDEEHRAVGVMEQPLAEVDVAEVNLPL
jgi:hypothetical protein